VIEEEIHMLLEEGTESGIIDETKQDMFESVFEFGDEEPLITRRNYGSCGDNTEARAR